MLLRYDRCELDVSAGLLRVDGRSVPVQPKVFSLLCVLMQRQGGLVTKTELFETIWPNEFVTDSALTWCVSQARRALGQSRSARKPIETVHRRGYRFTARVVVVASGQRALPAPTAEAEPFVGREEAMQLLAAGLAAAQAGHGRLCLITGEAGIGKTRTAAELALRARQLGFDVWRGCGFPGDGSAPLWPWVQVLRDAATHDELAADVSRLLALVTPAQTHSAQAHSLFWVLDQLTQFLVSAPAAPRLLLLDDLHHFDDASLRLLLLLAQRVAGAPLVLVATLRVPARMSEQQQHSCEALAALAERIELGSLDRAAVARYAQVALGSVLPDKLCLALLHKTSGIPLFVRAAIENLARRPRTGTELNEADIQVPDTAYEILVRSLRAVSIHAQELLEVACVLGDELSVPILQRSCQLSPAALLLALDEVVASHILRLAEQVPWNAEAFTFRHSLLCEILYGSLASGRRAELHLRVARALESSGAQDRSGELAYHYHRALPLSAAEPALQAAQRAAEIAARLGAYEQAARFQSWALDAFEFVSEPDPRQLAELLARAAELQRASGQHAASHATASRLIDLAKRCADVEALLRAVRTLRISTALAWIRDPLALDALETARALAGDHDAAITSQILAQLSLVPPYAYDMPQCKQLSARALSLARQTGHPSVLQEALRARLYALSGPADLSEQLAASDELLALVESRDPAGIAAHEVQLTRFLSFLSLGDMGAADEALAQMLRAARLSKVPEAMWHAERLIATRQLTRGEHDAAERAFQALEEARERLDLAYENVFLGPQTIAVLRERGTLTHLKPVQLQHASMRESHIALGVPRVFEVTFVPVLVATGHAVEARRLFEELAQNQLALVPENTCYLYLLAELAEASVALRDLERAEQIMSRMRPYADFNAIHVHGFSLGAVSHYLGRLAQLLGREHEARTYLEQALEHNLQTEQPTHAARSGYLLARLLRHVDPKRAAHVLDRVEASAQVFGMAPLLERAQRLRSSLS